MHNFLKITCAPAVMLAAALALPTAGMAQSATQTSPAPQPTAPRAATAAPPPAAAATTTPAGTARNNRLTDTTGAQRVNARINDMHTKLKITTAEQPQWDQFAQVMRDNATAMDQAARDRSDRIKSMNAADNMQSFAELAQTHAQQLQRLSQAFQMLYNSLSDDQKKNADTMFRSVAEQNTSRKTNS